MRVRLESPQNSGDTPFEGGQAIAELDIMELDRDVDEDSLVEEVEEADGSRVRIPKLSALGITTSEELIKRLKSREDAGEVSKLLVAQSAYREVVVPIAKKELLISDWILDVICKEAKEEERRELLDLRYWHLLIKCTEAMEECDLVAIANRHSIPDLLFAYSLAYASDQLGRTNAVQSLERITSARTSKQAMSIDTLNQCVMAWLSQLGASRDNNPRTSVVYGSLRIVVQLWCTELERGSNIKKASQFFLAELLPIYSELLWKLDHSSNRKVCFTDATDNLNEVVVRSLLHRISYDSLYGSEQLVETQEKVLQAVRNSGSAFSLLFPSVFLAQLCLHRKERSPSGSMRKREDTLYVEEREWRQDLLTSFIAPTVDVITTSVKESFDGDTYSPQVHVESLGVLLRTVEVRELAYADEDNQWGRLLARIARYVLDRHNEAVRDAVSHGTHQRACLEVLSKVHEMDETVIVGDLREAAILCTLDHPASKGGLLDSLCSSSMKSRQVSGFVDTCMAVLERAVTQDEASTLASKRLIKVALFDGAYWKRSLGVALQNFVSPDQCMEMLDSTHARLQLRLSRLISSSPKKRKRKEEQSAHLYALAVVDIYFVSQLLAHLAIPAPLYALALDKVSSLHKEVIGIGLAWALTQQKDPHADAIASALLVLHETLQELCSQCGASAGDMGSTWVQLASRLDDEVDAHLEVLHAILTNASMHSDELRVQVHLSVIKRLERDVLRGQVSPYGHLVNAEDGRFGFLTDMDINDFLPSLQACDSPPSIHWLHSLEKSTDLVLNLWDIVLSQHLATFDRLATPAMLTLMAKCALLLAQAHFQAAREGLLRSAKNLELVRWRDALCQVMKERFAQSISSSGHPSDMLGCLDAMAAFPPEWYSREFLTEMWPKIFHFAAQQSSLPSKACRALSHGFLARCLEAQEYVGRLTIPLTTQEVVGLLTDTANESAGEPGRTPLRLFKACVFHTLDDGLTTRVKQVLDLLLAIRARDAGGEDSAMQIVVEATAYLVELLELLLLRCGSEHAQLTRSVVEAIKEHIIHDHIHLESMGPSSIKRREELGLGFGHTLALLQLHRASMRVLVGKTGIAANGEELKLGYEALLRSVFALFKYSSTMGGGQEAEAVGAAIMHSLVQASETDGDVGLEIGYFHEEVLRAVPDFKWLALFASLVSTMADDARLDCDVASAALGTVCRRAQPAEYEATIDITLASLADSLSLKSEEEREDGKSRHSPSSLLQTLSIMLCQSPEGTLIVSQEGIHRLLATMAVWINGGPSRESQIMFSCIHTIQALMKAKPILFRSSDMATTFAMLARTITVTCSPRAMKSQGDDEGSMFFFVIVATLTECIRHRRDLVASFLPQLTILLKQLLGSFQVWPQSGGADKSTLQETNALGVREARHFTRLLSTLTSKSTTTSSALSKVKSLAKPFSTHAPYVIVAFVQNITLAHGAWATHQTSFVKGEARDELTRAVYNLCDIVGPWQKNIMMDILADEGDRIVFRGLWRGWESQRYKGA